MKFSNDKENANSKEIDYVKKEINVQPENDINCKTCTLKLLFVVYLNGLGKGKKRRIYISPRQKLNYFKIELNVYPNLLVLYMYVSDILKCL